jgi:hypothetical protein
MKKNCFATHYKVFDIRVRQCKVQYSVLMHFAKALMFWSSDFIVKFHDFSS